MLKIFLLFLFIIHVHSLTNTTQILVDYLIHQRAGKAFDWLAELCDDYGHRKVGSLALERAINHVVKSLESDGLDVHTENVYGLPNWKRGDDLAVILEPRIHELSIMAIHGSPPGKVHAEVVVLNHLDQLKTTNVTGRIVVFNQKWQTYGKGVKYRESATKVQKYGALAVLIRSVTPFSLYSVHTGKGAQGSKIPTASITVEEAEMIERWVKRSKNVVMKLDFKSMMIEDEPKSSRNVIIDIKGSHFPNEIVLLSAHIDTWDVGQGAVDDGGGVATVREILLAINHLAKKNQKFRPKRTIRGVLWTAEEIGMLGSKQYFENHFNKTENFVFVSESDMGAFRPLTYNSKLLFKGLGIYMNKIRNIVRILKDMDIPLTVVPSDDQVDVSRFANAGVPSINYEPDRNMKDYFQYHHSNADYMNVFTEGDLETTAAIFGALVHNIANMNSWLEE